MKNKKLENKIIKIFDNHTIDNQNIDIKTWKHELEKYIENNDIESIKSIIEGCAIIKGIQKLKALRSNNQAEKDEAIFKSEACNIFMEIAVSYFNIYKNEF